MDCRLKHVARLYEMLGSIAESQGGVHTLHSLFSMTNVPQRGVYFFFDRNEQRIDTGSGPRIVRIGTHALRAGSKATLKNRLSQHRGIMQTGSGNHRGSIFRLLIGQALIARDGLEVPTWGRVGKHKKAAKDFGRPPEVLKASEIPIEVQASAIIRDLPVVLMAVPDKPGPSSLRGFIERNSIALVSNYNKDVLDQHTEAWLGNYSDRERVKISGLWNSNHIEEDYDPRFLDIMESLC